VLRRAGRGFRRVLTRTALVLLAAPVLAQQGSGTIAGRVADSTSGSPVSNATVLVAGTLLRAETDDRGQYRIGGVVPGEYAVRVAVIGFESRRIDRITVRADSVTQVDFALTKAIVRLSEVAVTASGRTEKPGETPASEAVMAQAEIVDRNVLTLDQALDYIPGVILNHGDIDIRGSTGTAGGIGSRVMVMFDGHPVLSGDGESVDFSAIPLLDVQRIEVVKGGYSALYGSNALGGVINVITTPIGDQPMTAIGLHYGLYQIPHAFEYTDRSLSYSGVQLERSQRVSDDIGLRFFVDRESNAGYEQDNGINRWLGYTKAVFNPDGRHPGSFYAIYKWENDGNFLGWVDPQHPYQVPPSQINDHSIAARVSAGATFVPLSTGWGRIDVNPYVDYNLDRDSFPSDTINPSKYHRSTRLGTRADWTVIPGARQSIILGTDLAGTTVESDELANHTLGDAGVFAQDEVSFTSAISGLAGLRYDWHGVAGGGGNESSLSPKAGIVYHPTADLATRVSIGHGYRAPSIIEEYTTAYEDGFIVEANPLLHGETSWSGEVGATDRLTRWLWSDGALYQTDYWGLIGPSLVGGGHVQFRNITRARIRGLDLAVRAALIPNLMTTSVNYTLLDAEDLTARAWLPYRSRHNVTGSLDLLSGLCGVDLHYRSRVEQVLIYAGDPRTDITTFDFRLGYRLLGALLQAKLINAFQEQYVDIQERNPGQPRTLYVSAVKYF
jgi:outer membrane cobalamin receptor